MNAYNEQGKNGCKQKKRTAQTSKKVRKEEECQLKEKKNNTISGNTTQESLKEFVGGEISHNVVYQYPDGREEVLSDERVEQLKRSGELDAGNEIVQQHILLGQQALNDRNLSQLQMNLNDPQNFERMSSQDINRLQQAALQSRVAMESQMEAYQQAMRFHMMYQQEQQPQVSKQQQQLAPLQMHAKSAAQEGEAEEPFDSRNLAWTSITKTGMPAPQMPQMLQRNITVNDDVMQWQQALNMRQNHKCDPNTNVGLNNNVPRITEPNQNANVCPKIMPKAAAPQQVSVAQSPPQMCKNLSREQIAVRDSQEKMPSGPQQPYQDICPQEFTAMPMRMHPMYMDIPRQAEYPVSHPMQNEQYHLRQQMSEVPLHFAQPRVQQTQPMQSEIHASEFPTFCEVGERVAAVGARALALFGATSWEQLEFPKAPDQPENFILVDQYRAQVATFMETQKALLEEKVYVSQLPPQLRGLFIKKRQAMAMALLQDHVRDMSAAEGHMIDYQNYAAPSQELQDREKNLHPSRGERKGFFEGILKKLYGDDKRNCGQNVLGCLRNDN